MKLTDWRGNEYGVGDMIVYPRASGRSVEMSDGVVTDIYKVYYSPEAYKWKRFDGAEPPDTGRSARTATRVQVKPTGLGSRGFWRGDWREYRAVRDGEKQAEIKPVTICNIENVTVVGR